MNPLQLLPPRVRMTVYAVYGVLALAATAIAAYFTALDQSQPDWLVGGSAALLPIGAAFAAVAVSNTTKDPDAGTALITAPADVHVTSVPSPPAPDPDPPADVDPLDEHYEGIPQPGQLRGYGEGV